MRYLVHALLPLTLFACASSDDDDTGCGAIDTSEVINTCLTAPADERPLATNFKARVSPAEGMRSSEGEDEQGLRVYQVTADDPSVVEVAEAEVQSGCQPWADVVGKRPGKTTVRFKSGDEELSVEVEVVDAQRVEVAPFLEYRAQSIDARDFQRPPLPSNRIDQVIGGWGYWHLALLSADNRELRGSGPLTVDAPDLAEARVTTHGERARHDVLEVKATAEGEDSLRVAYGDIGADVVVRAVPPSAVASVRLFAEKEGDDGTMVSAMARAFDANNRPLYATPFTFAFDQEARPEQADFVRYQVDRQKTVTLSARYGDFSAETQVHAAENNRTEGLTRDVLGCNLGGGSAPLGNVAVVVGLMVLGLRRRGR